eukprot:4205342-Amphidinium_carterae.1
MRATVYNVEDFEEVVSSFRVSAVRVAMMLESARPLDVADLDENFEQEVDARTLSSLLHLRCHKDHPEELDAMYRLLCRKLSGTSCACCSQLIDEDTCTGGFGCQDVVPALVPLLFVPQCGHAIHAVCFATMLVQETDPSERGRCRHCLQPYGWSGIDLDPLLSTFCWIFGKYVDREAQEMRAT